MTLGTETRALLRRVFGSPDYDRLSGEIAQTWIDLDRQVQAAGPGALTEPWTRAAYRLLLQAESDLRARRLHEGWNALLAAQRALLASSPEPASVKRAAIILRREEDKISGWRAKAIADLIGDPRVKFSKKEELTYAKRMRVIEAMCIRDDQNRTMYLKIALRRQHLFHLFLLVWLGIGLCLLLSFLHLAPPPLASARQVAVVVLFGVLGATVSVAQSLMATDVSAKIPAQQIGSFLVWMRPGIGAAAALIALALLQAPEVFKIFNWTSSNPAVVAIVAFAAGYSERFIIGAIERISQTPKSGGPGKD